MVVVGGLDANIRPMLTVGAGFIPRGFHGEGSVFSAVAIIEQGEGFGVWLTVELVTMLSP